MADELTFGDYQLPAMEAGAYRISVGQEVRAREQPLWDHTKKPIEIAVQGLRFTLPPDRVHGRFPAPGAIDDFADVLPHIVLTSPTLPWQREPRPHEGRSNEPWLALLVFHHADPAPEVRSGTLADLVDSDACIGAQTLETGEKREDPCQYVDIDKTLFDVIAPRFDELRWLTHVRTLNGQEFAVVVGNRLPAPGSVTRCCLVSLEDAFRPDAKVPGTCVRLPVLDTWTFGTDKLSESFGGRLREMIPGALRVPGEDPPALAHGYTVLPHAMRQGAQSASWYQGPLVPSEASKSVPVPPGADSPDELLRYDRETGMFDVSLAAAWQLGRLLALADAERSVLIAAWKAGAHRAQALAGERQLLAERLEIDALEPAAALQAQLAEALVAPLVDRLTR